MQFNYKSFIKNKSSQNKVYQILGIISLGLFCQTNLDAQPLSSYCITPYVGLSGQLDRLHFEQRFGGVFYNRKLFSGGVIAGLKFSDYFAVELEYQVSQRKKRTRTLGEGQMAPERRLPLGPGQFEVFNTRIGVDTTSLNLVGFWPLDFCWNNIALFGSVGASFLKVKANHVIIWDELVPTQGPIDATIFSRASYSFKSSNRKLIPSVKIGLQSKILDNCALRLFINWKDTAKFDVRSRGLIRTVGHLKFKSLFGFGAALIYSF